MKIDLIYTFFEGEQQFRNLPLFLSDIETETDLKNYVLEQLTEEEKELLVKVSCALETEDGETFEEMVENCPQWFLETNGKLWFNDHKRAQYGLD